MGRKPFRFERAPQLVLPSPTNSEFRLESAAGRNMILVFLGAPLSPAAKLLMAELNTLRAAIDDKLASLFFVVSDPAHIEELGVKQDPPGIRYFMDYARKGALDFALAETATGPVTPRIFVMDRNCRILDMIDFQERKPYLAPILAQLKRMEEFQRGNSNVNHAPVLVMERVFETGLCRKLIEYYNERGGRDSGFMSQRGDYTVAVLDHSFKRRQDCMIEDTQLRDAAMHRLYDRLVPEIRRAFQYNPTRIERHIIACYDATSGGYFRAHRDNTTRGTAHRRFAVTMNLNAEEFEGGELRFPEFGEPSYRAPTGGAVVFSCSLLHEALPVTKGLRYAYLPFLYSDADAEVREKNREFLDEQSGGLAKVTAEAAAKT